MRGVSSKNAFDLGYPEYDCVSARKQNGNCKLHQIYVSEVLP
jgi:hypothetical protein